MDELVLKDNLELLHGGDEGGGIEGRDEVIFIVQVG